MLQKHITPFLIIFAAIGHGANALLWEGPAPTPPASYELTGFSPKPTARPQARQLFVRGGDAGNICGSDVGGDGRTSALTCDDAGYTCFQDSSIGAIGCCQNSNAAYSQCKMHTRCVNNRDVCLDACQADPLIKKCASPTVSCGTWVWQGGFSSFECDTVSFSVNVLSAKEGVLQQRQATSKAVITIPTNTKVVTSATTKVITTGNSKPPTISSEIITRFMITANGGPVTITTTSVISASGSPTDLAGSIGKKKPNLGVIIGASVGGAVFLACVLFGIWFFCRRTRKEVILNDNDNKAVYIGSGAPFLGSLPPPSPKMNTASYVYDEYRPELEGNEVYGAVELDATYMDRPYEVAG